jgi:electron-transferring-flavoprotein dehydrogenase
MPIRKLTVCILEKGSEIGAHILSGAVVDPKALDELLPDWRESGCPMAETPVTDNWHWVLTKGARPRCRTWPMPPLDEQQGQLHRQLGNLCRWLAGRPRNWASRSSPAFRPPKCCMNEDGSVKGVATGDMGVAATAATRATISRAWNCTAKYTLFAEGARGHLTKQLKAKFDLEAIASRRSYGIGMKELWDIDPAKHKCRAG